MSTEQRSTPWRGGLLLTALLLAAAVVARMYAEVPEADPGSLAPHASPGSLAPRESPEIAIPEPRAAARPELVGIPAAPKAPAASVSRSWLLHVRLVGLPPEDRATVVVSAGLTLAGAEPPVAVRHVGIGPDDRASLDVTPLLLHPQGRRLVEVAAAGALPFRTGFHAPSPTDDRLKEGGEIEVEAQLTPCCLLSGRVELADGSRAAGTKVRAMREVRSERPPLPEWEEIVECDPDGRFRVRSVLTGDVLVVAGSGVLRAPALEPGERRDLGTLRLVPGTSQEVLLRDPQGRPVTVPVDAYPLARPLVGADLRTQAVSSGGDQVGIKIRRHADAEGRVLLRPLLTGRVWIEAADHPWGCHGTREVLATRQRLIEVPSEPVTLELRRALLTFDVRRQDAPVEQATLLLETPSRTLLRIRRGRGEIVVPPNIPIRVTAVGADGSSAVLTLEAPPPGAERVVRVDLEPGRAPAPEDAAWLLDATHATLSLGITATLGASLPTDVVLSTADGRLLTTRWIQEAGYVGWLSEGQLVGVGQVPARCVTPLPPGDYVLVASAPGHRPARVAFTRASENDRTTLGLVLEAE